MRVMAASFPELYKADVLQAIETIELPKVSQAIDIFIQARQEGRRIFVCGNGGSASTASHFVCDMLKGASFQRDQRFRIMALTDSGNSPNVLQAVEYANSIGCRTIALSGRNGGKLGPMAQLNLQASHPHMGRIEIGRASCRERV